MEATKKTQNDKGILKRMKELNKEAFRFTVITYIHYIGIIAYILCCILKCWNFSNCAYVIMICKPSSQMLPASMLYLFVACSFYAVKNTFYSLVVVLHQYYHMILCFCKVYRSRSGNGGKRESFRSCHML